MCRSPVRPVVLLTPLPLHWWAVRAGWTGSVATVAARRVDRRQLLEVECGNHLELVGEARGAEVFWQVVEPGAVFVLQRQEGGDGGSPTLRSRPPARRRRGGSVRLMAAQSGTAAGLPLGGGHRQSAKAGSGHGRMSIGNRDVTFAGRADHAAWAWVGAASLGPGGVKVPAAARYTVFLVRTAQAMRAILLARATAACFAGIRASSAANHGATSGWARARPIRPLAATTGSGRRWRSRFLLMPPTRSPPPLEFSLGTRPIQAEQRRPLSNRAASPRVATMALDRIGPNSGMVGSRWLSGLFRCHARIWRSRTAIWAAALRHCSTSGIRIGRITAGTCSSSGLPSIANSAPNPAWPLAATMPISARWARIALP